MSALRNEIAGIIAEEGPIGVERYIALCLGHPRYGYYATRDPFGAAGDFTTAPEISQMFGELVGLWAAEVWRLMGSPASLRLVELGPGRGTLMADAMRAARVLPDFREALDIHLVETSPTLRTGQREMLRGIGLPVSWSDSVDTVPAGPAIVIANEFFDALPVRQYMRAEGGWRERLVGLGSGGALVFGLAAESDGALRRDAPDGAIIEIGEAALASAAALARRLAGDGGAALVIDYGHLHSGFGDTLQAVRRHAFADPLAAPGEADLTVHVDFAALGEAARRAGAALHGPTTQGELLAALGIGARAAMLKGGADERQRAAIDAALARLTGDGADEMGTLFKAIAIAHPSLPRLPGFAPAGTERP